jgi:hypothetical protein
MECQPSYVLRALPMPTDSPSSSTDPFAKTHEALYALVQELSSKQALELDLLT